jgi:hypothetical protein
VKRFNRLIILLVASAAWAFFGCASVKYQPIKGDFGYVDSRITPNIYRVAFVGLVDSPTKVVEFLNLFRCAELTIEKKYTFFTVWQRFSQEGSYTETQRFRSTGAMGLPSYESKHIRFRKSYSVMEIIMYEEMPPMNRVPIDAKQFIDQYNHILEKGDYPDIKDILAERGT